MLAFHTKTLDEAFQKKEEIRAAQRASNVILKIEKSPYGGYSIQQVDLDYIADNLEDERLPSTIFTYGKEERYG